MTEPNLCPDCALLGSALDKIRVAAALGLGKEG